jgi:hypothetical protein
MLVLCSVIGERDDRSLTLTPLARANEKAARSGGLVSGRRSAASGVVTIVGVEHGTGEQVDTAV